MTGKRTKRMSWTDSLSSAGVKHWLVMRRPENLSSWGSSVRGLGFNLGLGLEGWEWRQSWTASLKTDISGFSLCLYDTSSSSASSGEGEAGGVSGTLSWRESRRSRSSWLDDDDILFLSYFDTQHNTMTRKRVFG